MESRLKDAVEDRRNGLTRGQGLIADFILEHPQRAAFMTSFELAAACGVGQSSVVRFARAIGYDGFGELQDVLRLEIKHIFSAPEQLSIAVEAENTDNIADSIACCDIANIRRNFAELDIHAVENIAFSLKRASKIFIYAQGQCAPAAAYAYSCMRLVHQNVVCLNYDGQGPSELIKDIAQGQALLFIAFPVYGNESLELVKTAKEQGAYIASLTHSQSSAAAVISDENIVCRCGEMGVNGTIAPLISICGTISTAMAGIMKNNEDLY